MSNLPNFPGSFFKDDYLNTKSQGVKLIAWRYIKWRLKKMGFEPKSNNENYFLFGPNAEVCVWLASDSNYASVDSCGEDIWECYFDTTIENKQNVKTLFRYINSAYNSVLSKYPELKTIQ